MNSENSRKKIYCWGASSSRQLGQNFSPLSDSSETTKYVPRVLENFAQKKEVIDIAAGLEHTVFLLKDGSIYTCGSNDHKQLGRSGNDNRHPGRVNLLETNAIKQVACGEFFTLVLNSNNHLYAFGDSRRGQAQQTEEVTLRPRSIQRFLPPLNNTYVVQVVCGSNHCMALTASGQVYSWGDNKYGQLGTGEERDFSTTPTEVSSLSQLPIYLLAAGGAHSFVLTISGTLFGWGKNQFGQLGLGDEEDRKVPTCVKVLKSKFVRYVCCGEEHTAALTKEGRVFTFGCGNKGQLGHNKDEKVANPKQVVELMGNDVTQVACGRWHTLAYIQKTGRLYAFGHNKFGQLGDGTLTDRMCPTEVRPTWKESGAHWQSAADTEQTDRMEVDVQCDKPTRIHKVISGGYQSFVFVEPVEPDSSVQDFSDFHAKDQATKFLTKDRVAKLLADCKSNVDAAKKAALNELFMIFSSASCLNGSFLDEQEHETSGLESHGLKLLRCRESLEELLEVECIRNKISKAIKENLFPSLKKRPPDVEAMRVYFILPEVTIYEPQYGNKTWLCTMLAERILDLMHDEKLGPVFYKLVYCWWTKIPASCFSSTIRVFKTFVEKGIEDSQWSKINNAGGEIVSHETFYIPCIQEKIDIARDYTQLFFSRGSEDNQFFFCRFMFVFDVKAKAKILETDARIRMHLKMEQTLQGNLQQPMLPNNPYLIFNIRRDFLVRDTLCEMSKHMTSQSEFLKPLKVVFNGEEGIDAGGLRKEFFLLLIEEIFDLKYGMFVELEDSNAVWFQNDPQMYEDVEMYFLIGLVCGLALYNSTIIDIRFPLALYKKLLDQRTNLDDFRYYEPNYARTLQYLLDYDTEWGNIKDIFSQGFQIEEKSFDGSLRVIDLKPNGGNIDLTADNREEYVDAVIDYKLNKSVMRQFEKFRDGFFTVCDKDLLSSWHPQELKDMIVGCENYDSFMKLRGQTTYANGYTGNEPVIEMFWGMLRDFNINMKKKFLAFLTGSDKISVQGIENMKITIQPLGDESQQDLLPQAMTCFNLLSLPRYRTERWMKMRFTLALNEFGRGFGRE
eukprot:gene12026-13267_t